MAYHDSVLTSFTAATSCVANMCATNVGDALYALCTQDSGTGQGFTAPTGWAQVTGSPLSVTTPDSQTWSVFRFTGGAPSSPPATYTFTPLQTGLDAQIVLISFSGRSLVETFITPTSNSSGNSSPVTIGLASGTITAGDDLIVFAGLDKTGGTWSYATATGAPGTFTQRQNNDGAPFYGLGVSTLDNAPAGAGGTINTVATISGSGTAGWGGFVIALKVAAGGGTSSTPIPPAKVTNPWVGPTVLRQLARMRPATKPELPGQDAPPTSSTFIFPTYPADSSQVGPMALRVLGRRQQPYLQQWNLAPPTRSDFSYPIYRARAGVGPAFFQAHRQSMPPGNLSAGTAWFVSVADTVTVSDALAVIAAAKASVGDTVSASDAAAIVAAAKATSLADTVSASDALTIHAAAKASLSETTTASDSLVARAVAAVTSLADSVGASDAVAVIDKRYTFFYPTYRPGQRGVGPMVLRNSRKYQPPGRLSGATAWFVSVADTVPASDAIVVRAVAKASLADTVSASDAAAIHAAAKVSGADTATGSDSLLVTRGSLVSLADTVTASDALAAHAHGHFSDGDIIVVNDSVIIITTSPPPPIPPIPPGHSSWIFLQEKLKAMDGLPAPSLTAAAALVARRTGDPLAIISYGWNSTITVQFRLLQRRYYVQAQWRNGFIRILRMAEA